MTITNEWHQMFVKPPEDCLDVKSLLDHLNPFIDRMTCVVEINEHTGNIIGHDGTVCITGFNEFGFRYVKKYLEENGFTIESEGEYGFKKDLIYGPKYSFSNRNIKWCGGSGG